MERPTATVGSRSSYVDPTQWAIERDVSPAISGGRYVGSQGEHGAVSCSEGVVSIDCASSSDSISESVSLNE